VTITPETATGPAVLEEVDVLEREIFRYTAQSITEELELNITRTAYSPLIQESQDYCISLISPDFRPYMQSQASIPIFVSDMGEPVRQAVTTIGADQLESGDVFVINHESGQHLNNVVMATPLYHGDQLSGYLSIRAHWADVGGLVPGGQSMNSRSIHQEGTRYVGLRLMRAGVMMREVLATFQANTYQPEALTGDLLAQLAACSLGARRWQERVVTRWSAAQVQKIVQAQLSSSAQFARAAIRDLPDGTYVAKRPWQLSHGGIDLDLMVDVRVEIDGDRFVVDLSNMPPEAELPINAGTVGGATAAAKLAFRYLVAGDYVTDDGFFEPVEVIVPEGTIVSASTHAPMANWNTLISLVIDLIIQAIGSVHPELVPASHGASVGGLMLYGYRADGSLWRHTDSAPGGLGAEATVDGYGPVKALFLGNMKSLPIEMAEQRFPLKFAYNRLDWSAGGDGLHRGGPAVERVLEVLTDAVIDAYPEQTTPPQGLAGGGAGQLGKILVQNSTGDPWLVPVGGSGGRLDTAPRGAKILQRGSGGGGWGRASADSQGVAQ
jgi:N-methylhydantoinase B